MIIRRPQNSRTWGQGHLPEVEEENYFNDDDDEEIPTPPIARTEPLANMPRRRRQRISMPDGVGAVPLRTPTKQQAIVPSQQRPQTPTPLGALVDYDDDDDVIGPQPASAASSSRVEAEPRSVSVASVTPRQIQIPAYDPDEPSSDPEDDMLEALVTHNEAAKRSPSPKFGASDTTKDAATSATDIGKLSGVPPIQRDKRRREEDDDDELLVRIAAKSKRANSVEVEGEGRPSASKSTNVTITAANKSNEEGPKKLKLKIGLSKGKFDGASQASSTGTKDGDRG
jgi:protein phosphatase-4 regulatory subunit 3